MKHNIVNSLLFFCSAYLCLIIVSWPQEINAQAKHSHWVWGLYYICPWVLAYLSLKGWHITRIWRRMLADRYAPPSLSRGEHRFNVLSERVSFLEYLCLICLALAVFALMEVYL